MAGRFRLTPEADAQLGDILEFIAHESETGAIRVRHAMYDALAQLAGMLEMGHTRQDLTDRPLKFWSIYSYLIVYDPATSPLTLSFFDGLISNRDWSTPNHRAMPLT